MGEGGRQSKQNTQHHTEIFAFGLFAIWLVYSIFWVLGISLPSLKENRQK